MKECFDKRLLRRERPDLEKSKRSIEVAEAKLDEAEKALSHKPCDATIILAYTAMFHAAGAIASICVGALAVGRSGALKGRRATTYHLFEGKQRRELAAMVARVVDAPLVRDGGIITSTSPATAIDVAFALLEDLASRENVTTVRRLMGFESSVTG